MSKVRITQTKSKIGQTPKHRATLETLGLRGISRSVVREETPELAGQLRKVAHLVRVEKEGS